MQELIRKSIRNTPAMNTLMVSVMVVGAFCLMSMRREVFPEFSLDMIVVQVPYPGASPEEVEEGICQKLEEAVRSIDGIRKQVSIAAEGSGSLQLELTKTANTDRVLAEVRSEVDRISTFPVLAEDPEIRQITFRDSAIQIAVVGPDVTGIDSELALRNLAESVREELLRLPTVSQVNLNGIKNYQIDIEISEDTLRRFGLTLQNVAQIIRQENLDLPAGTIQAESQDVLVRGNNKRVLGSEIAKLPLITRSDGAVLTVGEVATVRDEFEDQTTYTRINGLPAVAMSVDRTTTEDLLKMTEIVNKYVAEKKLPEGYQLFTWGDRSIEVRDRLDLLVENGIQGLLLVLVLLGMFLNLRLAFWVALGIPISILGACTVLYMSGQTLNMLSSFSFVMALGIVVDDAIVISENIYMHRQQGKPALQSAIDGTIEVFGSVLSSVATTVIAFIPLLFVSGIMGKFIAIMPFAMIATLTISLLEATFILPCHLAHDVSPLPFRKRVIAGVAAMPAALRLTLGWPAAAIILIVWELMLPIRLMAALIGKLGRPATASLEWFSSKLYSPVLHYMVRNPAVLFSLCLGMLLITAGMVMGGKVPFIIFPKVDSNTIQSSVSFPDGTSPDVTAAATLKIEQAIQQVSREFEAKGEKVIQLIRRSVGNSSVRTGPAPEQSVVAHNVGSVVVELTDASVRETVSDVIAAEWRKATGSIAGAESLTFGAIQAGPGGTPIEFKLLAARENMEQLQLAVEDVKAKLETYPGVFDIKDDLSPGKWEFRIRVKDQALAMGVPLQEIAQTVRGSYYGEEVMRLQRGRHEVKLMVRYPPEERRSLAAFNDIRIRTSDGYERPITELADVEVQRGYSEINRVNQLRSVTISADVEENVANAAVIVSELRSQFMPELFNKYPALTVRWEGQQEQSVESVQSLAIGLAIALVAMFVLLTLQFTSYYQPLLILAIIPFGLLGAIWGHALLGLPLTLFSLFGMVTLTGIVVNDSIVLIDFINAEVRAGTDVRQAVINSGIRRLRPIFLTSITTIAGLMPLLFEKSFQAQILIPMAVSICFGLLASTLLCLVLVPTFYLSLERFADAISGRNRAGADHESNSIEPVPASLEGVKV